MKCIFTPTGDMINTQGMSLAIVDATNMYPGPEVYVVLALIPSTDKPIPLAAYSEHDIAKEVVRRICGYIYSDDTGAIDLDVLLHEDLQEDKRFVPLPWRKVEYIPSPGKAIGQP